ncbi:MULTISPECIES: fimbrial protein [unclassified Cupriavidus]|uniref:fimbrial protein n=1 Tax=unclassified Cupriavidus TaxID=2640874 RepID=UPI0010F84202|nr:MULTISPECIES: fimbrial protein [unclassified Cupriavidus]MWL86411.1 type 1 fimbrial protein [Cupriavidus sp. SW-Y-13]
MRYLKATLFAAAASLATIAPQAFAADGTITFTGAVSAQTCTVAGPGGNTDFSVTLPTVRAAALSADGDTAGRTPFNVQFTGCNPTTGNVAVYFEPSASMDVATGRLRNMFQTVPATETTPAVNPAGNVQIGVLNADLSQIMMGSAFGTQNSQTVPLAAGAATLRYFAQYVATGGGASAGQISSTATYSVVYP